MKIVWHRMSWRISKNYMTLGQISFLRLPISKSIQEPVKNDRNHHLDDLIISKWISRNERARSTKLTQLFNTVGKVFLKTKRTIEWKSQSSLSESLNCFIDQFLDRLACISDTLPSFKRIFLGTVCGDLHVTHGVGVGVGSACPR